MCGIRGVPEICAVVCEIGIKSGEGAKRNNQEPAVEFPDRGTEPAPGCGVVLYNS